MGSTEMQMEIDEATTQSYSDDYEEETLLYVEVDPSSMTEMQLRKGTNNLKIFGLDAKEPVMQISNRFFQGEFDLSMGTHVFLEKVEQKAVDELYCKCDFYYNFTAATKKVLKVSRVLLKDKAPDSVIQPEKEMKDIKNQLRVAMNYEDALNMLLAQGRQQPRNIARGLNGENLLTSEVADMSKSVSEDTREADYVK